jgi:hypothetical protein
MVSGRYVREGIAHSRVLQLTCAVVGSNDKRMDPFHCSGPIVRPNRARLLVVGGF